MQIDHIAIWVSESTGYSHIAVNVGSVEKVDMLSSELKIDGVIVERASRVTGDGHQLYIFTG